MRTLGPKSADPMQTHAGSETLDHVARFGFGVIDASFQAGLREHRDGNYGVMELEGNGSALTILAVAHGAEVLGREAILAGLGDDRMAEIREQVYLVDMGRQVARAMLDEIDRGLLQYLGSPTAVVGPYRATIECLALSLDHVLETA